MALSLGSARTLPFIRNEVLHRMEIARWMARQAQERVSILEYGPVGSTNTSRTRDDTNIFQAAINDSARLQKILLLPSGTYNITRGLTYPQYTQIIGEHNHAGFQGGTIINFAPSTTQSLFTPASASALQDGFSFENLYIAGNSTSAGGASNVCLDLTNVINSTFRNLRIQGFRTAMHLSGTINNKLDFIRLANNYIQNINYTGNNATTDTWFQAYISNAPVGIQTSGANIGIRFLACIFETIENYGLDLARECYGWLFDGTNYVEDTPSGNNPNSSLFRVGYSGTTLAGAPQLFVRGGYFGGRNLGGGIGALLDVDQTDGVFFGGGYVTRYTNVVRTTASTPAGKIFVTGWEAASISVPVSDPTKVTGFYPPSSFNGPTGNRHLFWTHGVAFPASQIPVTDPNTLDDYNEASGSAMACTGAINTTASWKATKIGNKVTLTLPPVEGSSSATSSFTFGDFLPLSFRPSSNLVFGCSIKDGGTNAATPGAIAILSTGAITVYRDLTTTTNFAGAGVSGLGLSSGASVSWTI